MPFSWIEDDEKLGTDPVHLVLFLTLFYRSRRVFAIGLEEAMRRATTLGTPSQRTSLLVGEAKPDWEDSEIAK